MKGSIYSFLFMTDTKDERSTVDQGGIREHSCSHLHFTATSSYHTL